MIKGIYTAASGMAPRILKQEAIANNLANVNTPGYKRESVFLQQLTAAQARARKTEFEWQIPMVDQIYTDYSRGSLEHTGNPLNVAIDGDGFFVVQTPEGEAYTRSGSFHVDSEGRLVTADNLPVLCDAGEIVVSDENRDVKIAIDGNITIGDQELGRLRVADFEKPYKLEKIAGGLFKETEESVPLDIEFTYVRQGYLEKANVDVIREMVDMIDSYRNYESDQRAIQLIDETLARTVNEVGKVK
jgi:flagellar basal-body rod protein FlgG